MVLNKESILSASDLKRQIVPVPEWGEGAEVIITELSALDRLRFSQSISADNLGGKLFLAAALIWFIVDESGARIFAESDIDALAGKSLPALKRLFDVAQDLSKFGEAEEAETKN